MENSTCNSWLTNFRRSKLGITQNINNLHHRCNMQSCRFRTSTSNQIQPCRPQLYSKDFRFWTCKVVLKGLQPIIKNQYSKKNSENSAAELILRSFGILLTEIAGGQRNVYPCADNSC